MALTDIECTVLLELGVRKKTLREVAVIIGRSHVTVNSIAQKLISEGYLERGKAKSARAYSTTRSGDIYLGVANVR